MICEAGRCHNIFGMPYPQAALWNSVGRRVEPIFPADLVYHLLGLCSVVDSSNGPLNSFFSIFHFIPLIFMIFILMINI